MSDTPTFPEPLVPAEVDLRDFAFMPLDVQRLRDSDLASDETPEACWAAVLLWCASWHQVPAASIPDNDQWQAKQCGYVAQGKVAPGWKRARAGALRHWLLCSDGRLYHPVVAEKALDAWRSKLHQRWKTEAARIKKHNQRHNLGPQDATPIPEFDDWIAAGCPQGHALYVPEDKRPMSPGSPQEIDSKRQGQGQGQGQGKEEIPPVAPQGSAGGPLGNAADDREAVVGDHRPTRAGELCRLMKAEGIPNTNPGHPDLLALIAADVSDDEVRGVCAAALGKGNPFAYALAALTGQRQRAAAVVLHAGPLPTTETPYQRAQRERMQAAVPSIAAKAPGTVNPNPMEVLDARIRTPR